MDGIASSQPQKKLDCTYMFVCSNHFQNDDFSNLLAFKSKVNRRLILKPNAVPSIKNITASSNRTTIADDNSYRLRKRLLLKARMAIASHPTFFPKNIASNYRIKTTNKIASVIALQNLTKKICDFFDYFDFFVFNSM